MKIKSTGNPLLKINMRVTEVLSAFGHNQIRAVHPTTLEITKEKTLTSRGDCIVAVGASKGSCELSSEFKRAAQHSEAYIILTLTVEELTETVKGYGNPRLEFSHQTDLVARKSSYICNRTIMINADKAAVDFSRKTVSLLRNPGACVHVKLEAIL